MNAAHFEELRSCDSPVGQFGMRSATFAYETQHKVPRLVDHAEDVGQFSEVIRHACQSLLCFDFCSSPCYHAPVTSHVIPALLLSGVSARNSKGKPASPCTVA